MSDLKIISSIKRMSERATLCFPSLSCVVSQIKRVSKATTEVQLRCAVKSDQQLRPLFAIFSLFLGICIVRSA